MKGYKKIKMSDGNEIEVFQPKFIGTILLIVGVAIVLAQTLLGLAIFRLGNQTSEATGRVISVIQEQEYHSESTHSKGPSGWYIVYVPVISFEASDGNVYTFKGPSSYSPDVQVGQTFDVQYNPDNPSDCDVAKSFGEYLFACFAFGLFVSTGIGCIVFGIRSLVFIKEPRLYRRINKYSHGLHYRRIDDEAEYNRIINSVEYKTAMLDF